MINRRYAWNLACVQGLIAALCAESYPVFSLILLGGIVLQLNLLNVFRSNKINIKATHLFEENQETNKLKALMCEDKEFGQALSYVTELDRKQFIVFCRTVIEVRNEGNRLLLKELSSQYRREK